MGKGSNRDWGYASSDDKGNLTYTSYEKSGSVNRYSDNGDGGHSHEHWDSKDNYNSGKDSDWSRSESNSHSNPSTGDVQSNGGCYLTTACMKYFQDKFDNNCYELKVLRWFRDNFVSKDDIKHYYETAQVIVSAINMEEKSDLVYNYIYDNVVDYCVRQIENGNYEEAYNRYKNSILVLEEQFARKTLEERFIKVLRLRANN